MHTQWLQSRLGIPAKKTWLEFQQSCHPHGMFQSFKKISDEIRCWNLNFPFAKFQSQWFFDGCDVLYILICFCCCILSSNGSTSFSINSSITWHHPKNTHSANGPWDKAIYTPQNKHGTWKWGPLGKGDSYWKPSFPGSMLIFGGVNGIFFLLKMWSVPKVWAV